MLSNVRTLVTFRIGSPKSSLWLVRRLLKSIEKNFESANFEIAISFGPSAPPEIRSYVLNYPRSNLIIHDLGVRELFWSEYINQAIKMSLDYDYFMYCHDDIEIQSNNFLNNAISHVERLQSKIGWVGFTDTDYLSSRPILSVREGFHIDYLEKRDSTRLFQFHNLEEDWWFYPKLGTKNNYLRYLRERNANYSLFPKLYTKYAINKLPLDFPKFPVRVHSHWNHLILIPSSSLAQIGNCESWETKNALLVDEDWCLEATLRGFQNVWIPNLKYHHFRPKGGTRSWDDISRDGSRVHELFKAKWGFYSDPSLKEVELIQKRYKGTGIDWSIGKNSFDYEFVK